MNKSQLLQTLNQHGFSKQIFLKDLKEKGF